MNTKSRLSIVLLMIISGSLSSMTTPKEMLREAFNEDIVKNVKMAFYYKLSSVKNNERIAVERYFRARNLRKDIDFRTNRAKAFYQKVDAAGRFLHQEEKDLINGFAGKIDDIVTEICSDTSNEWKNEFSLRVYPLLSEISQQLKMRSFVDSEIMSSKLLIEIFYEVIISNIQTAFFLELRGLRIGRAKKNGIYENQIVWLPYFTFICSDAHALYLKADSRVAYLNDHEKAIVSELAVIMNEIFLQAYSSYPDEKDLRLRMDSFNQREQETTGYIKEKLMKLLALPIEPTAQSGASSYIQPQPQILQQAQSSQPFVEVRYRQGYFEPITQGGASSYTQPQPQTLQQAQSSQPFIEVRCIQRQFKPITQGGASSYTQPQPQTLQQIQLSQPSVEIADEQQAWQEAVRYFCFIMDSLDTAFSIDTEFKLRNRSIYDQQLLNAPFLKFKMIKMRAIESIARCKIVVDFYDQTYLFWQQRTDEILAEFFSIYNESVKVEGSSEIGIQKFLAWAHDSTLKSKRRMHEKLCSELLPSW